VAKPITNWNAVPGSKCTSMPISHAGKWIQSPTPVTYCCLCSFAGNDPTAASVCLTVISSQWRVPVFHLHWPTRTVPLVNMLQFRKQTNSLIAIFILVTINLVLWIDCTRPPDSLSLYPTITETRQAQLLDGVWNFRLTDRFEDGFKMKWFRTSLDLVWSRNCPSWDALNNSLHFAD